MKAVMYSDGGARGNPGPAAIGVVITFPNEEREPIEISEAIGDTTNNVAEYRALLRGLHIASSQGVTSIDCFLDSELVVKQLQGIYRIRDARLAMLAQEVQEIAKNFSQIKYAAVPRSKNKAADRLVNRALDLQEK